MELKLRPLTAGILAVGLVLGLGLASSLAYADTRPVGGNSSVWDKACAKSGSCMPVGDLGHGNKGYIVTNPGGGGTTAGEQTKASGKPDPLEVIQGN